MKLKKIASLALAGVMAVSMLAGCSDKGNGGDNNNGGNTVVEPSTSSIVAALNNNQDESNKVKVNFTSDASLDAALQKAVKEVGNNSTVTTNGQITFSTPEEVRKYIVELTGKAWEDDVNDLFDENSRDVKDKAEKTVLGLAAFGSGTYWTEADAINAFARAINDGIKELPTTTKKDNMAINDKYYDYSYTGTASMVSSQQASGSTVYWIAYTIEQTAAEKTVKAE